MTLLIATPVRAAEYGVADVKIGYHDSMRELYKVLPYDALPATIGFGCDVVRARNRVVAHVLRDWPKVTRLLWWDDDLWPDDARVVNRLLDYPGDIVACGYTNKQRPLRWVHESIPGAELDAQGFVEVVTVGLGFTMMSRACLERSTEASYKSQEFRPYWDEWGGGHMIGNVFGLMYDRMFHGRECLRSEDYSFCARWRKMGGKIHIYGGPGNVLRHAGGHGWSAEDMPGGILEDRK